MIDIAEKAGVSLATVGRVLQGSGGDNIRVGEKTAQRVRQIARQMRYRPNLVARQLAGKRSMTIGVLMDPKPTLPNSIRLAEIGARARELGYHLMTLHEQPEPQMVAECMGEFVSRGVDGVICIHHAYPGQHELVPKVILDSGLKNVVFIDKPVINGACSIGLDYAAASRKMLRYLLGRGRRRIGFALAELGWYTGPHMRDGFLAEQAAQGLVLNGELLWVGTEHRPAGADLHHISVETGHQIIEDLVVKGGADAIMTADDHWAAQLLNCLVEKGYRVPEDIAVAGCGNQAVGLYTRPMLTSIDLRHEQVARGAVDMLVEMIENEDDLAGCAKDVLVEPVLVVRDSA